MRKMWSKGQVENVIQKAIDSGDIKLYEDMQLSDIMTIDLNNLELVAEEGYCSIRKTKENELYAVINFSLENQTESSIALVNNITIQLSLPSEIASKIYDVNGKTIHDTLTSISGISAIIGFTDSGSPSAGFYSQRVFALNNNIGANACYFQLRDGGTIPAGKKWFFTLRMFLTL